MPSYEQRVLAIVRRKVINGDYSTDDRISEVAIAEELGVSRTPARTALAALEAEGLIEKRRGRGYSVRRVSTDSVENTIEIKAVLEGLAARNMAMNGISREVESRLAASIEQTAASLESPGIAMMDEYQEANIVFHHTIMMECGNELIAHTYERIRHLPFAELGTLAFENANYERERTRLTVGFSQHVIILDAIRRRDAARAEAMMREHSHATLNYSDLFAKRG
ncbi:GntR family transcriptional regulator [Oricola sp.]|uniref:GntR family transcriptional regulator n=1 Tax=Oricola sp. TaxID=1979950 RepID=UPI000C9491C8|nr:GntR family transcriptional regulator [Ahrensia sp.]|tara:strand:- start:32863 stop:33534 length:672 start_codon:yes stop_codon:yes gene_type:complete